MAGIGVGDINHIDVEEKAIFQGHSGSVQVSKDGAYTVFVNDDYTCNEVDISIHDDIYEYFNFDCDPVLDEKEWRAVGWMVPDIDGTLNVDSDHEIIIIDDIVYLEEGGYAMAVSGITCCCGILGLIIGSVMASTMRDDKPPQFIVMPHDGGQVSFQAQPATYTPGQPVVLNQEVSNQPPLQSNQPWEPPQSGV